MREINFRAWAELAQEMIEDIANVKAYQSQGFYLMQYTGLLDKNGREIYEGDIIRGTKKLVVDDKLTTLKRLFVCEYSNEFARFSLIREHAPYSWSDVGKLEVIGNIYEDTGLIPS
jgi:uncharacterized phage protein (TIGR01671 family)